MLAVALARHHDELYADFREYYGIDLWDMDVFGEEHTRDVDRASILAAQLPGSSRLKRAASPLAGVTTTDALLREIEYNQRIWLYANSEDAKRKVNIPEPIRFDGEEELKESIEEREASRSAYVAAALGLEGLEAAV